MWVSIGVADLLIHDEQGELIAEHRLAEEKGRLVIDEEHYAELRKRRSHTSTPELERQFLERFAGHERFLDALKRGLRSIAPIHLREILALARRYRREEVEAALERACADGTATAGYVRELLSRERPAGHIGKVADEIPRGLSLGAVDPGSPAQYGKFFSAAGDVQQTAQETEDAR